MRFIYLLSLLLQLILLPSYAWAQKDFKSSEWATISGKENHKDELDFSGTIKANSNGEKIIIEADIKDDNVIFNNHHHLSDRIDLWLSIVDNPEDTLLSVVKDSNQINKQIYFIKSNPPLPNTTTVSFGTVHYIIQPSKERKIHLADNKSYDWIEKSTGERPGNIIHGVDVKTEFSKLGYKLTISISPLGLGFIELPRMDKLKFNLQIQDVDSDNQYSLHSISPKGEFHTIEFTKSLRTNVTSVPTYLYDSLQFHPILMFNSKGFWSGITRVETSDTLNKKIAFIRTPIGYRKWEANKVEIIKLSRHLYSLQAEDSAFIVGRYEENYFSKNNKFISYHPIPSEEWQFKGLQKEFTFQDNFPGLLIIQINADSICNYSSNKTLLIYKLKGDKSFELLKIKEEPCTNTTSLGSLSIKDYKIEKIFWQKEGLALMVEGRIPTKGDMKYRISFQGDKALITPIKK